jgi:hypothetical protein
LDVSGASTVVLLLLSRIKLGLGLVRPLQLVMMALARFGVGLLDSISRHITTFSEILSNFLATGVFIMK